MTASWATTSCSLIQLAATGNLMNDATRLENLFPIRFAPDWFCPATQSLKSPKNERNGRLLSGYPPVDYKSRRQFHYAIHQVAPRHAQSSEWDQHASEAQFSVRLKLNWISYEELECNNLQWLNCGRSSIIGSSCKFNRWIGSQVDSHSDIFDLGVNFGPSSETIQMSNSETEILHLNRRV